MELWQSVRLEVFGYDAKFRIFLATCRKQATLLSGIQGVLLELPLGLTEGTVSIQGQAYSVESIQNRHFRLAYLLPMYSPLI
jgi:hypothetical protein